MRKFSQTNPDILFTNMIIEAKDRGLQYFDSISIAIAQQN